MKKVTRAAFAEAVSSIDQDLLDAHFDGAEGSATPQAPRRFPWRQVLLTAAVCALLAALVVSVVLIARRGGDTPPAPGTEADTTGGTARNTPTQPAAEPGTEPPETRPVTPAKERETVPALEGRIGSTPLPNVLHDCALAQAELPKGPDVPGPDASQSEWDAYMEWSMNRIRDESLRNLQSPTDFLARAAGTFLSGTEADENRVIAPFNVWLAMAMTAEITGSDTRDELLTLLGAPDIDVLRRTANGLYRLNCVDDGTMTSLLASSLWLNRAFTYRKDTLDALRDGYYASVYAGEMGSEAYNESIRAWVNYWTGGLLSDQASRIETQADTAAVLYSTLYFHADWAGSRELEEEPGVFRGVLCDRACTMLKQTSKGGEVCEGTAFLATDVELNGLCVVRLLLPKEGYTVDDLLADSQAAAYAMGGSPAGVTYGEYILHTTFPSFDVSTSSDLIPGLQSLGVRKCFVPGEGDFSPLTDDTRLSGLYISRAKSDVRLIVDREGVSGAAYVQVDATYSGIPDATEEFWFTCDRPFLCVVLGNHEIPLFAAVVNDP